MWNKYIDLIAMEFLNCSHFWMQGIFSCCLFFLMRFLKTWSVMASLIHVIQLSDFCSKITMSYFLLENSQTDLNTESFSMKLPDHFNNNIIITTPICYYHFEIPILRNQEYFISVITITQIYARTITFHALFEAKYIRWAA